MYDDRHVSAPLSTAQARFRLLLVQYEKRHGHGFQTRLSSILGVHQTTLSKILAGDRGAGIELVEGAIEKLGASWWFFSVKRLPDGAQFDDSPPVGAKVTRLERDEERSPYPAFEDFVASMRSLDAITDPQVKALRSIRYSGGAAHATAEAARDELARIVREQSVRAVGMGATPRLEQLEREGKRRLPRKRR